MLFYRYELRWKRYEELSALKKEEKSDFEIQYSNSHLVDLNEKFYYSFLKERRFLLNITGRSDSELDLYLAVDIKHLNEPYEKEMRELFDDCEIVRRNEVTMQDYKREVAYDRYGYKSRDIFEKLKLSFREGFFDPYPFSLNEEVTEWGKMGINECRRRAKDILGSSSMFEEIERIYSKHNAKTYYGHPVHYMLSAGDWEAAKEMCNLLLRALHSNGRVVSNRMTILRKLKKGVYKDDRFRQIIETASGSVIIMEMQCEEAQGRFATDFHELTKVIGKIMEHEKKDTLFIFVEIKGKTLNDNDALNNILTKADFIQVTEGTGTYEEAKKYLLRLTEKVDFVSSDKSDAVQFLPEKETYLVSDIFDAYNSWYGSGLKNHVYKAYKSKTSFKVEITKRESKPYEELQNMIGLTEIKSVVDQIIATSKILRVRERMGLNTEGSSMHMLFSGNPGTAKTTVARLLAQILKDEDAIASGRFVECGRQALVGKYVGWTAPTVEQKFKEAQGGILFIDEAYALVDDSNTYGAEAINCITQMMENYRNDVIVIFAGYPDKMQNFLAQNEGLKSRIAFHLNFPDYTADELTEIISLMAKKKEYAISDNALEMCKEIFKSATEQENFGNGRFARNVLEQAILKQSNRIVNLHEGAELGKEELCSLQEEDFAICTVNKEVQGKRIGFI